MTAVPGAPGPRRLLSSSPRAGFVLLESETRSPEAHFAGKRSGRGAPGISSAPAPISARLGSAGFGSPSLGSPSLGSASLGSAGFGLMVTLRIRAGSFQG